MRNEFFGQPNRYEFDDFSAHSILEYVSLKAQGRAWTREKLQRVSRQANDLLDESDDAGDSLDVFAMVGDSEIQMEYDDEGGLMPCTYGDKDAILWGQMTNFAVKSISENSRDVSSALCVRVVPRDGLAIDDIFWLPIAKAGSYGLELQIASAPDVTSIEEVRDTPEVEAMLDATEQILGYWHIAADSILTDNEDITSQELMASVERMRGNGAIIDLDDFSTAVNMVISEGLKEGDEFTVEFSGEVERMGAGGKWSGRYVDEKIYSLIAMEFSEDSTAPGGVRSYAYMADVTNTIVRATMHDNNFLIEHVVTDATEDVE